VRTKSEARRQTILEVAAKAFNEGGFEATSMSEIAARVGGSKATLYNYFPSKEALFAAVMVNQVKEHAAPLVHAFVEAAEIGDGVRRLAPRYIRLMLRPEVLAVNRLCVAEGERCGFGPDVYKQGPKPAWNNIAERLKRAMDEGALRKADPWTAALHLKALCEAGLVEEKLRGWRETATDEEIAETGAAAAEAFLRAYRPD